MRTRTTGGSNSALGTSRGKYSKPSSKVSTSVCNSRTQDDVVSDGKNFVDEITF